MPKKNKPITPKFTPSHPSAPWRVYYRGKSFWFADEADALKKCADIEKGRGGDPTNRDVDEIRHCKELLQGTPLLHAVRYFIERNPRIHQGMTVKEAVDQHLLRYKDSRPSYGERKKYLLDMLATDSGGRMLSEVGPETVERLLDSVTSSWTKNDLLTHLRTFFRSAVKKRILPEDPTLAFSPVVTRASKVILTVPDARHVLKTAAEQFPDILPAVCLQLFAGVRTEEITRLEWSDVKQGRFVNIEPHVAKTHERRVIDWWPAAMTNWMPKKLPTVGPICPNPRNFEHRKWMLIAVCRGTKKDFKFGQNAFRHSFCSFACSFFENAGKASLLAGQHDVHIFFKSYRDYRTKEEAEKYFSLSPGKK